MSSSSSPPPQVIASATWPIRAGGGLWNAVPEHASQRIAAARPPPRRPAPGAAARPAAASSAAEGAGSSALFLGPRAWAAYGASAALPERNLGAAWTRSRLQDARVTAALVNSRQWTA